MNFFRLIMIGSAICLVTSCTKEKADFRKKYIGNWFFKVHRSELNTKYYGYYLRDSLEFVGQIELASNAKEIKVKYTSDDEFTAEIDEKGNFIFPVTGARTSSGAFEGSQKVSIIRNSGGQGGGIYHEIDGIKQ